MGRPAWDGDEAAKDEAVLRWVERFRFVTAELVARRFGVSCQRANARLRRLEKVGLVGSEQRHVCEARAVFVTGRGATVLGVPRRRPPRTGVQREHELAIVALAIEVELAGAWARVLTDRECRRAERREGVEYSLRGDAVPRDRRHWPISRSRPLTAARLPSRSSCRSRPRSGSTRSSKRTSGTRPSTPSSISFATPGSRGG